LDEDCSYAHATLGLLLFEKNDLDAGCRSYERAMELRPDDVRLCQKFHYEYGRAMARDGRKEEARSELNAALSAPADYVSRADIEAVLSKLA
jgi:Flp pilus assembly protein TadD